MSMPLWFSNLAFWGVQSALLTAAAGLLPRLFRIRQPHVLLGYWRAVLAVTLALPWVQPWHRAYIMGAMATAPDIAGSAFTPASDPTAPHRFFPDLQVIAWIFGIVLLIGIAARLVILALGLLKLRQLRRASLPLSMSAFAESAAVFEEMRALMSARAEFRVSAQVDSPVTFGFADPVILLPERIMSMNAGFQGAIACHELVHVRRHDWVHHLAEETIRAVFWFHPPIAWLITRLRLAREQAVDLEVVRLTKARKTYLEALLQFATSQACTAGIPAPPFLVERQLAERVALMLKEIRMSQTRLIASLATIACGLALVIALAAKTFPLQGAPLAAPSAPAGGIDQGIKAAGAGVHQGTPSGSPSVERSKIWVDTVKQGPMVRQVRGLGTLVRGEDSANLVARVMLPEVMTAEVHLNQSAIVDTHRGLVKGHVSRMSAAPSNGTRSVDIALDAALPERAGADQQIDGMITIEKLDNVVYVGRPVHGAQNSSISLFKIVDNGKEAMRVNVKLGRSSAQAIEVLDGLRVGDKVILSDMSNWENIDRLHIK